MRRLLPIPFLLLLLALVLAVSFDTNVTINSGSSAFTDDDLTCTWDESADTTAVNVTWYREGSVFSNTYDNSSPFNQSSMVNSTNTTKNEEWRCEVTLFNATANITQSYNLTIQNSAPTTPIIYNSSGVDVGTSINVTEDATTILDVNSSDLDSDTLTYYFKAPATFCTVTNSATGAVSCSPTHSDVVNSSGGENVSELNITFWVDDDDPLFAKSASKTVLFSITPVNDDPALTIADQSTNVSDLFNETFTASDEELDYPLNATLNTSLTDTEIVGEVTVTVEGNATVRVTYQSSPVDYNDVGNRTITINLSDARGASILVNFTLEILSVNRNPYFTNFSPNNFSSSLNRTYVISQGQNIIINISASDFDINGSSNSTITFSDNTSIFAITTVNSSATNSSDALGRINFTPTNAEVGNHSVLVTITDGPGDTNSTVLNFTILDVNDPPVIYNQSSNASNTNGNINITPLIAFLAAPFSYQVNFSDPDTIHGEVLNFTDNTSTINITAGGLISFTPTGAVRNETINITLSDDGGLSDSVIITLEIRNNSPPYFNQSFDPLLCSEGASCFLNISAFAREDDPSDNITAYTYSFTSGNLTSFSLDNATGIISFTPTQSEISNYSVDITITDSRGATATQELNITINNTEDAPSWVRFDFSAETIVQGHLFSYQLRASDQDILLAAGENLTFTANLSWFNFTYSSTVNATIFNILSFTPNSSHVGNHTVLLNVTDTTGLSNTTAITFEVLAATDPPNITFIRPYGNDSSNNSIVTSWLNVSNATTNEENISLSENTTVTFEANATDDATPVANLNYTWYYDGTRVNTSKIHIQEFTFFSSGSHTLMVLINDSTLESSNWTWNLIVADVNRPPVLENNLTDNLTIDSTTTFTNYFLRTNNLNRFFDPDDDTNGSGIIDGTETSDLTYSATACSAATIEFTDDDLRLTPVQVGSCVVTFNATDSAGASVQSNLVTITVTEVPESVSTTTTTSSGGGGSSSRNTFIPFPIEVETPHPLNIVTPDPVSIYENSTVTVPLIIENNWTNTIEEIKISATTNATDVEFAFDTSYIPELEANETAEVKMTIFGYRLGESFEVKVFANATDPAVSDSALILFSSIEQSEEGKDVNVKVTFARDLLSQNDECKELNELLLKAEAEYARGNTRQSGELLDAVINGCKYLISKTQEEIQKPGVIRLPFIELTDEQFQFLTYLGIVLLILLILGGIFYFYYTQDRYNY